MTDYGPIARDGAGSAVPTTTPFKSSTIMMVDDEPTTIEVLEVFLQGEGYEHFVKTIDSREAVDLAREKRPDVVLLDWMMPVVGGRDILAAIRSDEFLRHTPVIILTSSTDAETKLEALELGATDFLGKPVDPSELALRIRNTLAAKSYQDRLANYDSLTGLPNRNLFLQRLERTLTCTATRSIDGAMLHLDIDRFQMINDTLGHSVGDSLLKAVSDRLEQSLRSTDFPGVPGIPQVDDPLCRVGGNEFALLLPGAGAMERAAGVARRLLLSLSEPFRVDGHELFLTSSIGIALFATDGTNMGSVLSNAHIATSHAKKRGSNRFQFYNAALDAESAERLNLESDLRRAIERKELLLYFQPKIDIATGRLVSAEALMRWDHPELGLVPPDRFISIAEETELIDELGNWALLAGCQQNQAWQDAGYPAISVAVNVSAKQFQNPYLVDRIRGALHETRMDPAHLILELTESTLMENPQQATSMLTTIKSMGVRTSIDDFGTGYSSLSFLKRFPLDELKIDRSFLKNIPRDEDDVAIVSAIILIGHAMGVKVVAEGVETSRQLAFLAGRGCDTYQGFLRSKPLPPDEFEQLLRAET